MDRSAAGLLALLLLASGVPADAQESARAYAIGVSLGPALQWIDHRMEPGDEIEGGAHGALWVTVKPPGVPGRFQIETHVTFFETSRVSQVLFETPRPRKSELGVSGINANFIFDGAARSGRPYFIGGIGYYHLGPETVPNPFGGYSGIAIRESDSGFGANGGVGLKFMLPMLVWDPLDAFVEVRYHAVFAGEGRASYLPISVGWRLF
jgi:hypothetical protein